MTHYKALIAGATGQIGQAVSEHFLKQGLKVIGMSRGAGSTAAHPMLQVDLTDPVDCRRKLSGLTDITHFIYAARYDHIGGQSESADINAAMLANVLNAIEPVAPRLEHVHLVHGTKYYGHNRARPKGALREDMLRGNFENFYFSQQDFLEQRSKGGCYTWTISRPHTFCNFTNDEPRSITLAVAVYASLLRELRLPLIFPGTPAAYAAKTQFTWLPFLAEAIHWMSTTPACNNEALNVVNDDPQSWASLWPQIAAAFSMDAGEPGSMAPSAFIAGKDSIWQELVAKYGLREGQLQTVVQWPYADYVFSTQWDVISSMAKARSLGFTGKVDSGKMWTDSLAFLAREKIVPPSA